MLGYLFFGPYDWLLIPGLLVGLYAQLKLSSTYKRYVREPVQSGLSGAEAAREILDRAGLSGVRVVPVAGHLTDHYDPNRRTLCLSHENYHGRSVAALGVAAHEAGHALQHQAAYAPLQLRMMLVPATNFATTAAGLILVVGFLLVMFRVISPTLYGQLLPFAIGAYAVVTFFQLITLPVEYDASRRAKQQLLRLDLIRPQEQRSVHRVLNAAALTYVAALVTAVLELTRLVLVSRSFSSDD
ncbi:MAG: zinc metallopeptidase [Verrucomicrobia bacterium]|nr:zinc metallopeptidase [Verrucomicrobiota bacterium]